MSQLALPEIQPGKVTAAGKHFMWAKPLRDLETVGMFCISEEKVLGSPEALGTRRKPYKDSTKAATVTNQFLQCSRKVFPLSLKKWMWVSRVLQLPKSHPQMCSQVMCTHLPGTVMSTDLMTQWNHTESPALCISSRIRAITAAPGRQILWEWFIQLLGCCQTVLYFHSLICCW